AVAAGPGWRRRFVAEHRRLFGHGDATRPLEVVTLRVRARAPRTLPPLDPVPRTRRPRPFGAERVIFAGRAHATPTFHRETLGRGARIDGPAVICEYSATTVVPPGWRLRVDQHGALLLEDRHG